MTVESNPWSARAPLRRVLLLLQFKWVLFFLFAFLLDLEWMTVNGFSSPSSSSSSLGLGFASSTKRIRTAMVHYTRSRMMDSRLYMDPLTNTQHDHVINGEDSHTGSPAPAHTSLDTTITEMIRLESLEQYSMVMDHYMFELGNDMIFLQNQQEVSKYVDENFDAILFDCDGVLYRGSNPMPEAALSIRSLLAQEKKVLFVTNNAGSNRMQLRDKLAQLLQCEELEEEQMVCSSYSAAKYLQKTFQQQGGMEMNAVNVHVIGTDGLCEELRKLGANVTGGATCRSNDESHQHDSYNNASSSMSRDELASYSFEMEEGPMKRVDAVVVGLDTEFNYRKLCIANVLLQRYPDALLVATNEDAYDLVGADARHLPGNGSLVKAIEFCSQRKAINVGKPSVILADLLTEEHGLNPERTLIVGDRLDTDIKFGKDNGMKSALVFTGCTTGEKLISVGVGSEEEPLPHILFPHMGMMGRVVQSRVRER